MHEECKGCAAVNECLTVCMPGSILCILKRISTGQTKGDKEAKKKRDVHNTASL